MILIDTNALIVLLIGLINPKLIQTHKRTSIYEEQDFYGLVEIIGEDFNRLTILPNVWTEADNLLNKFAGGHKYRYLEALTGLLTSTTERYVESVTATASHTFFDLGLTDALLFEQAQHCDLLITSDSALSDYAIASGVKVYDMVKIRNERL